MAADERQSAGLAIGSGSRVTRIAVRVVLLLGVLVSLFPFYWLVVMASGTTQDIYRYPPKLVPGPHLLDNMKRVVDSVDFFGSLFNTVVVAVVGTALVLFFDSLAAFAFAKYDFPAKRFMFGMLLMTYMIPAQLSLVPQFVTMAEFGWAGSLKALIVPGAANAFGIFWMRQYAENSLPDELLDAGRIDGAGFFRLYWKIALPMFRPALAFLGIFTFIGLWNEYIWPLVVMIDPEKVTLQVALANLNVLYQADYSLVMAGALMSVVPLIIVFLIGARHFLRDLAAGATKM
ncbi:carbohydrate ABC transporter permease [Streptomyces acidiscabies]|uniref:Carbohydrate ABC transporter permease n=1 Tax=Streptomyces acidiscabies TaxID=42234 RepID=A0AAP6EE52_9ACTN|nr:carbohydrate ABC transporter permease [Streptomyces acidiscabies]MBP5940401.1 carbohydrate ABC transporter permease [Streptomyces sp. LBUM 1476]MBZ3911640.1 carbohydrate ABC transporter permease [Streptomyces acidiscabies]MDX2958865.1 carbohydrate ABC transporter permease [Streptomyces acidiscabies]MDX3018302.1 carbohydrate ABC transporter permease [Streptomyces acidiscabies]MDX3791700.1 carbohydrate ABC transporter permease [Streptomyces acidiscabies]